MHPNTLWLAIVSILIASASAEPAREAETGIYGGGGRRPAANLGLGFLGGSGNGFGGKRGAGKFSRREASPFQVDSGSGYEGIPIASSTANIPFEETVDVGPSSGRGFRRSPESETPTVEARNTKDAQAPADNNFDGGSTFSGGWRRSADPAPNWDPEGEASFAVGGPDNAP